MNGLGLLFCKVLIALLGSKYAVDRHYYWVALMKIFSYIALTTEDRGSLAFYALALYAAKNELELNPGETCVI